MVQDEINSPATMFVNSISRIDTLFSSFGLPRSDTLVAERLNTSQLDFLRSLSVKMPGASLSKASSKYSEFVDTVSELIVNAEHHSAFSELKLPEYPEIDHNSSTTETIKFSV